jgi:protein-S-isoprenylcysteine O-methyltransferase Ste14
MNTPEHASTSPDRAAVAFHPPVLLAVCIGGGFMERWLFPFPVVADWLAVPIGLPIVVLALALFVWAVITMRNRGASIPTHTATDVIVAEGPYRFSRNPIYLAMVLLLAGLGFWANAVWFFAWAILAVVLLTFYVIKREERYLETKFGETYLTYKRRTRRWI